MMVVVESLTPVEVREPPDVRRGIVEGPVASHMTETVDGGGQEEDVDHTVQSGREQSPSDADERAECGRADHGADEPVIE